MKLYTIKDTINEESLSLASPNRLQGGNSYYSKLAYNDGLYIQLPKCNTRNGIVQTNKNNYIDMIFNQTHEVFIDWIFDFEKKVKKLIQTKSGLWFQNEMDIDDIDYFFNSLIKPYKGTNYLFRAYVNTNARSAIKKQDKLQIYDEDEIEKKKEDVENNDIIPMIHIKGIKFTSSSFHVDVELKQVMILNKIEKDESLFKKCLIKKDVFDVKKDENFSTFEEVLNEEDVTNNLEENQDKVLEKEQDNNIQNKKVENTGIDNNNVTNVINDRNENITDLSNDDIISNKNVIDENEINEKDTIINNENNKNNEDDDTKNDNKNNKDDEEEQDDDTNSVKDVSLDITCNTTDDKSVIKLKTPKDVYYEIYKEALSRAKLAKKTAILAYLEAKNIKNTYMLDDIDSSDNEDDDEDDYNTDTETENIDNITLDELSDLSDFSDE